MRRSLSVGAVGVLISGAVLVAANANAAAEAPQTTVDSNSIIAAPALQAFAVEATSKVVSWGVPAYVVAPEAPVESTPAVEEAPVEEAPVEAPAEEAAPAPEAPVAPVEETNVTTQAETVEVIEAAPAAEPAPAPEVAPVEAASAPTVEAAPAPVAESTPAPVETAAPAPVATPEPTLSVATNQAKRDAVVAAALAAAAVNAQTDCTMLATNSLRAAGINFHGWPMNYMALGSVTSNPQPGDLVLYQSNGFGQQHIAVYIGNGQAVHGGWNGIGTSIFSVNLPTASAPIFVSPAGYNS
ncbi:NlpC/P60 family protein [Rothia nasimurium]|uniref:NlpC/P60 family protein n=1 Tax=Rothia nasimurium TaxID=85336 RepID=UPI001F2A32B0|nr:NlpC/P60 family protein [Rothia nasimurium]